MSDGAEAGQQVKLYVYDLSQGMARAMSSMLLGTQLDGIWHTGVVVGDTEYFYGGGIQKCRAGTTPFGQPTQKLDMGTTQLPDDVIQDFLSDIAPRFTAATYSLFRHNCNHFSDELCTFLLGSGIPDNIVSLPETVLSTPMGMMIAPLMQQMESQLSHVQAGSAALPPLFPAAAPVGPPVTASTREPAPSAAAAAAAAASDRQAAAAAQKLRALAGRDAASWSGELAAAATNTGQPVQDTACQQAEVRDRQKRALAAEFQRLVASGTPPNEAAAAALKKVVGKPPS